MFDLNTTEINKSSKGVAIQMFVYFTISENKQTFFYSGDIASLKHLIKEYPDDIKGLEIACDSALTIMYSHEYTVKEIVSKATMVDGELYSMAFKIIVLSADNEEIRVMEDYVIHNHNDKNSVFKKELI